MALVFTLDHDIETFIIFNYLEEVTENDLPQGTYKINPKVPGKIQTQTITINPKWWHFIRTKKFYWSENSVEWYAIARRSHLEGILEFDPPGKVQSDEYARIYRLHPWSSSYRNIKSHYDGMEGVI